MRSVGWVPDLAGIRPALGLFIVSAGDTCNYNVLIHTSGALYVFKTVPLVFISKGSKLSRVSFLLLFIIICSYFISGFGAENINFI